MKQYIYLALLLFSFFSVIESADKADAADGQPPAKLAKVEDPRGPELVAAVRAKDFETMKNLLDQGVPISTKSERGSSLLGLAAEAGCHRMFNYLVENGLAKDVNHPSNQGITPLMLAAYNGYPFMVRLLLEKGAEVNTISREDGRTALLASIQVKNDPFVQYVLVKLLLEDGADVNIATHDGITPLMIASQDSKFNETTRLLLEYGAKVNKRSKDLSTALIAAATHGNYEIVELLLDLDPETIDFQQKDGATALFRAARNGHAHVVQLLLERGANMNLHLANNNPFFTPLYAAAFNGQLPVIEVIDKFERQEGRSIIDAYSFKQAVWKAYHEGKYNVVVYLANKVKQAGLPINERLQRVIDEQV